jgi:hypothetical protein
LFAEVKIGRANDPAFADIEQSIVEIRQTHFPAAKRSPLPRR